MSYRLTEVTVENPDERFYLWRYCAQRRLPEGVPSQVRLAEGGFLPRAVRLFFRKVVFQSSSSVELMEVRSELYPVKVCICRTEGQSFLQKGHLRGGEYM